MFDLLEAIKEQEQKKTKPVVKETAKVIDLIPFLNHCCSGLKTNPDEVKNRLLNQGNIEDIISGEIPAKCIKAHIQLWVIEGKNNISGNTK
jgi:hypothetical protein